jgi:hypothetical protein
MVLPLRENAHFDENVLLSETGNYKRKEGDGEFPA